MKLATERSVYVMDNQFKRYDKPWPVLYSIVTIANSILGMQQ